MGNELIVHVFAAVQGLEKCLANCRKMLAEQQEQPMTARLSLDEQEKVLRQMRRVANKLQFELVATDWVSVVRSLRIYYGLCSMVRPDLMATFSALSNKRMCFQLNEPGTVIH